MSMESELQFEEHILNEETERIMEEAAAGENLLICALTAKVEIRKIANNINL